MITSISKYLQEEKGIPEATPGKKCRCPFCGHDTFSIKNDDTLGKCFHPNDGQYITLKELDDTPQAALARVLKQFCIETHSSLLNEDNKAFKYLIDERHIQPKVIVDSMLGIVPIGYNPDALFKSAILDLDSKIEEFKNEGLQIKGNKSRDSIVSKITALDDTKKELLKSQAKLFQIIERYPGWLIIPHTDSSLNITKLRLRKPSSKDFVTYIFDDNKGGVFGANLCLFANEDSDSNPLIVVEGEFNLLRLQSLLLSKFEEVSEDLDQVEYFRCVALGSAVSPDLKTVKSINPHPIICYDRDDAGFSVVKKAQESMHISAFCTPEPSKDLDEYISTFGVDHSVAVNSIIKLIEDRKYYYRYFWAVKNEIDHLRETKGIKEFRINQGVLDVLLNDFQSRSILYHDETSAYILVKETNKLFEINGDNLNLILLLDSYGINKNESIFNYVVLGMIVKSFKEGITSDIQRFSYYNPQTYTLYVHNHSDIVYKITELGITPVKNGTDGVLFLSDPKWEPFFLVENNDNHSCLDKVILNQINYDNDSLTENERNLLFKYWLYGLFFESIMPTKPIMCFLGQKGSGKSMTLKKVGLILFGSKFDVTPLGNKEEDFDTAVSNSRFLVVDNADSKKDWLEDKLAVISTGGSVKKRALYSNNDLIEIKAHCFLGITTRTPHFRRDDVSDRLIIMKVARYKSFKAAEECENEVRVNRNKIMTELLTSMVDLIKIFKLQNAKSYKGENRMADFAGFVLKAATSEGTDDLVGKSLKKLSSIQAQFSLEMDSVYELISIWTEKNAGKPVTNKELFSDLSDIAKETGLLFNFKSHISFSQKMTTLRPSLEKFFIIKSYSVGKNVTKWSYTPSAVDEQNLFENDESSDDRLF